MLVVKKYGNRRLYDTAESRYITLEELAAKVRAGSDVRIVDAKSGKDLTQATLTQVILESRGASKLLPVPLLLQLIRMGDSALAEFFGQFLGASLDMYLQAQQSARSMTAYNPFGAMPFGQGQGFPTMFGGWPHAAAPVAAPPPPMPQPQAAEPSTSGDVAELRRELEELKQSLRRKRK